jgi:hypothetical protein
MTLAREADAVVFAEPLVPQGCCDTWLRKLKRLRRNGPHIKWWSRLHAPVSGEAQASLELTLQKSLSASSVLRNLD